jgi:hypothetical protein
MGWQGSHPSTAFTLDSDTGVWTGENTRFYTGTDNQPVDSFLEGVKGVGKTPAYINRWYVVLENSQFSQFGNSPPNFTFEPYYSTVALSSILTEIWGWLGRSADDLDLSEIEDVSVRGFVVQSRGAAMGAIEQLKKLYSFRLPEVDGVITAVRLPSRTSAAVLAGKDLQWTSGQGRGVAETSLKQADEKDLTQIQEIQYWDVNRDYNPGERHGLRQVTDSQHKETFAPSAALLPNEAQQIADILIGESRQYSEVYKPSFAFKGLAYSVGDVLTIPTPNGDREIILSALRVPLFGAIEATAPAFDADIYNVPLGPDETGINSSVATIGSMTYAIIDTNSASDALNGSHGIYIAATGPLSTLWQPATFTCPSFAIQSGITSLWGFGGQPNQVVLTYPATMGVTYEALPDAPDSSYTWDRTNTLKVDLIRGELSSVTEAELLANGSLNQVLHNSEIIQFATATFIGVVGGKNRYELTNLLRGRRGTESFTNDHSLGDTFVLLDSAVAWVPLVSEALNTEQSIDIVASDGTTTTVTFTPEGHNLWPYSPGNLVGVKSGSDFDFTWVRRSRYSDTFYATGHDVAATGFDKQEYLVQIMDGGGNVVTGYTVTTEAFTYTEAEQITDFGTAQSSVTVRVLQTSQAPVQGYPASVTI